MAKRMHFNIFLIIQQVFKTLNTGLFMQKMFAYVNTETADENEWNVIKKNY